MWTREQLKSNAKNSFRRNYWPCVGVAFIMAVAEGIGAVSSARGGADTSPQAMGADDYVQSYFGFGVEDSYGFTAMMTAIVVALLIFTAVLGVFVTNVLRIGANRFFIQNRIELPRAGMVLDGFRSGHYGNIVLTMFLKDLYVTLWTLLLIIPGIIKELEYLMVPYILAENPGMNRKEAFAISKRMMDGEKLNAFILQLSFIGWQILAAFTCGLLGIFYVNPYMEATMAELYAYNKAKAYQEGYIQ